MRCGRREKREQGKDRHMKDGINERGLHSGEAYERGGVEGEGNKRREEVIQIQRDGDRERERECEEAE